MNKKTKRTFTPEFRLECAQLIVDKGYSESGGVFLDLYLAISLEKTIPTHAVNPVITPK